MKTINSTIILTCALGLIGLMNINAVTDNKKVIGNDNVEMLVIETQMTDHAVFYSAKSFSDTDIENEIEENTNDQILPDENVKINEVSYSAKVFSDIDFENEIKNRP